MDTAALVALGTLGGTAAGALIGSGIAWGMLKKTVASLSESHGKLKAEFVYHKDDREIHLDPRRDEKAEKDFRTGLEAHFAEIKQSLGVLNTRCEARGGECNKHFANVELKLAAATGKVNGGN